MRDGGRRQRRGGRLAVVVVDLVVVDLVVVVGREVVVRAEAGAAPDGNKPCQRRQVVAVDVAEVDLDVTTTVQAADHLSYPAAGGEAERHPRERRKGRRRPGREVVEPGGDPVPHTPREACKEAVRLRPQRAEGGDRYNAKRHPGRKGDAGLLEAVVDAPRAHGEVGVDAVADASVGAIGVRGGGGVEGLYL